MAASRRLSAVLGGIAAIAVATFAWALMRDKPAAPSAGGPVTAVAVAQVETRDVPVTVSALGQAQGWQAVVVRAEVSGRLLQVPVREGADVAQGALIAQIDPAPFRAELMQAQGALRRDQAQLDLARLKLERFRELSKQSLIAGLDVDSQAALVAQYEGAVMVAQGSVDAAQVDLDNTRIVAPVAGRVGVRLVDAGNLVSSSDAAGIVTINQISPIAVTFTLPQGEFQRLSNASDAFRTPLVTQAFSQETGQLLDTGELVVVDNRVDPATATVQLKARFANAQQHVWPGQLLNVRLTLNTLDDVTVLPTIAVSHGPNGPFAYVVENGQAVLRPLELELRQDDVTVVRSGVATGEPVVIEGQAALRPGARVSVRRTP